jgi:hypothetical protein
MIQNLHLPRAIPRYRLAGTLRALALLGLLLLPIQMRAGTTYIHPHALLHLLLDAGDGAIDHHALPATTVTDHALAEHDDHVRRNEKASPDVPTFESIQMAAGGLAVTLVSLILLVFVARGERIWPRREVWSGMRLLPELPPPRLSQG